MSRFWVLWGVLLVGCSRYSADSSAVAALESDALVDVETSGHFTYFWPVGDDSELGFVFYPGGYVEAKAYAPPLRLLAERGVAVALVEMPSDLAVLAPRRGLQVVDDYPDVSWAIGGHSLGGAMAVTALNGAPESFDGLALWAAYGAKSADVSSYSGGVISITASNDTVLDAETWEDRKALLPDDTEYIEIEGGNHAGFGDYGPQEGDSEAEISAEEQHVMVAEAMLQWWGIE